MNDNQVLFLGAGAALKEGRRELQALLGLCFTSLTLQQIVKEEEAGLAEEC